MTSSRFNKLDDISGLTDDEIENDSCFVDATITDGHSFKCLVEFLNNTVKNGIITFTKDKIIISRGDDTCSFVCFVEINTEELLEYKFESDNDEYQFPLTFFSLRQAVKPAVKKEVIRIFKERGSDSLQVGVPKKSKGLARVKKEDVRQLEYDLPDLDNMTPSFKTTMHEFSSMGTLAGQSPSTVTIETYPNNIFLTAMRSGNSVGVMSVGPGEYKKSDNTIGEYSLNTKKIKALVKIGNLNSNGNMNYHIIDHYLGLSTHISTYGRLHIFLFKSNQDRDNINEGCKSSF